MLNEKGEMTFKLKKLVTQRIIDQSLMTNPSRVGVEALIDDAGNGIIRALLVVATQEEQLAEFPSDWWQTFKERWFPQWLLHHYPVKKKQVWAIHKYPELDIPTSFLGREFVHLKIISQEELERVKNGTKH